MRVFVGEPGFEYKENFRTLSEAALAGGVTSVVTMPNTIPVIDNVSIVDFLKRRGRDKAKINIYPTGSLSKNLEGNNMTEFGLLKSRGIIGFTDGYKTIQNTRLMSRMMKSAYDLDCLIMHPGPMNRGIEIDTNLADDINKSVIKEQVELGVAVRMACLKIFCE